MSEVASVFVLDKATDAAVEANYFIEVCKEILNEPRFSDEEKKSSCFFHSAATRLLEHETQNRTFSNKLEHHLEELFTTTLNLSRLWPAFHKFAVG